MEPMTIAATASAAVTGGKELSNVLSELHQAYEGNKHTNLASYVKKSLVQSPCFIQESIAEETVINDVIKNLFNLYVGYIICALQMDQHVIGGRRVRDMLSPVSTMGAFESLGDEYIESSDLINTFSGSMEAITTTTTSTHSNKAKNDFNESTNTNSTVTTTTTDPENKYNSDKNTWNEHTGFRYDRDKQFNMSIAAGRTIEITLSTGPDSPPITIPVIVMINSRIVPNPVFEYIFGRDFNLVFHQRWLQYRSGEIRFVKDFIFNIDRLSRRAKALKSDKDGALQDILHQQNKSKLKKVVQFNANDKNNRSYNLANAIIIADEETVKHMSKKSGYNLDRFVDRQYFFNTVYALFIVLVDSRYSRVTIYTNGIEQSATYSYNELKSAASSDKLSLKEVVEYLTKSQMPRF